MFVCEHDEIIGCVKADVLSICQFDFVLIYVWFKQYVPKYNSDRVTQFKVREKLAEVPHMFQLSLIKMQMRGIS